MTYPLLPKLKKGVHLKSNAAFEWILSRELISSGLFVVAACLSLGWSFILIVGIVLGVVALGKGFFHVTKRSTAPSVDLSLLNQALLLCLFLPAELPKVVAALGAMALLLFYRVCGGRLGYALQPVCLTLVTFLAFESKPGFQLENLSLASAGIILLIVFAIRFPRSLMELQRMAFIFAGAVACSMLQEINFVAALLGCFVMGELIFDPALAPLSKKGRLAHQAVTLILFIFLLLATSWAEAFILTGLVMSFISGWMEQKSLVSKVKNYAKKN